MLKVKLIQIFCGREESIYHEIVLNHLLKKKCLKVITITWRMPKWIWKTKLSFGVRKYSIVRLSKKIQFYYAPFCDWPRNWRHLLNQSDEKKVELLVFSRDLVFLFLQVNSRSLFFLTLAIINVKKVGNINTRINVFVVHINFIYLEILNGINECYEKSLKWMDCADAFLHLRSNYFMKSFSYFSFKKIQTQFDRK